jgi:hypothetical protein
MAKTPKPSTATPPADDTPAAAERRLGSRLTDWTVSNVTLTPPTLDKAGTTR